MMRLVGHIERILLHHDCVIIPGFGGFVLQSIPAIYRGEEHSFSPARKEIVFNSTLTHNDGLLIESYMQEYAIDFNEARQYVLADVTELRDVLEESAQVEIGQAGMFLKEDNHPLFLPSKNSETFFCTSSYGLPEFHYLPLSALSSLVKDDPEFQDTKQSNREEKPVIQPEKSSHILYRIPVTRTFFRILAASIATILLFLLISPPVNDVGKYYSAGFVPPEIMPKKTVDEIVTEAFSETNVPAIQADATAAQEEAATAQKEVPAAHEDASVAHKEVATTPMYYVIIASYSKRGDALKHIKELKGTEAANAKILVADGRERVYIQSFSTEQSARTYMNKLLQNSNRIKGAWIYKAKK